MSATKNEPAGKPLAGKVAVVAGATRGAGRGIATMLGAAGCTVYCTGRSVKGRLASGRKRPETINETASLVTAQGGKGIAVRVDHTVEREVARLFARVKREQGRLDVLVNDVWGGDDLMEWGVPFWKLDMKKGQGVVYTITYGELEHPGLMEVEFHGHTEKDATGVGDLMFYSKTGGAPQSGVFTAPWDGIHGWYLKNDSAKDVTVRLDLAGFYDLQEK